MQWRSISHNVQINQFNVQVSISLLGPTLERVTILRYTKGPTGLAQLCSVNTRLIKKYWLETQVPPRIAALNQLKQYTEHTQYSLVSQFIENCWLAHPTSGIQSKRGINTTLHDGRIQNATQALTHRISNIFYSTHEQCSRPSPDTLWLSGRRKPPLARVYARKPSSLLRIGWLKSPHQYCVVACGPRLSNRCIDWHNDTTRAQNWPPAATRPHVNSQTNNLFAAKYHSTAYIRYMWG